LRAISRATRSKMRLRSEEAPPYRPMTGARTRPLWPYSLSSLSFLSGYLHLAGKAATTTTRLKMLYELAHMAQRFQDGTESPQSAHMPAIIIIFAINRKCSRVFNCVALKCGIKSQIASFALNSCSFHDGIKRAIASDAPVGTL